MAAPNIKTLDFAWLGKGVFAKVTGKALNTGSLDYASPDGGIFVATEESGATTASISAVPLTASAVKVLPPTVYSVTSITAAILTASNVKLLAPNVNSVISIGAAVLTISSVSLPPPTLRTSSIIVASILTAQHTKLLPPVVSSTSANGVLVNANPLTLSNCKVLPPSLILASRITAPVLTAQATKVLAPVVSIPRYILSAVLTAKNAKILSPVILNSNQIIATILTLSHAKIISPTIITSTTVNAIPLTTSAIKLLAPTIPMSVSIPATILTASHTQLLTPFGIYVSKIVSAKPLTASHAKILAPRIIIPLGIYISPDIIIDGEVITEAIITGPDFPEPIVQYIKSPIITCVEDPSKYHTVWYEIGNPITVDLSTYNFNYDENEISYGTAEIVQDANGVYMIKVSDPSDVDFELSFHEYVDINNYHMKWSFTTQLLTEYNDDSWKTIWSDDYGHYPLDEYYNRSTYIDSKGHAGIDAEWENKNVGWIKYTNTGYDAKGYHLLYPTVWDKIFCQAWGYDEMYQLGSVDVCIKDVSIQPMRRIQNVNHGLWVWNKGECPSRLSDNIMLEDLFYWRDEWTVDDNYNPRVTRDDLTGPGTPEEESDYLTDGLWYNNSFEYVHQRSDGKFVYISDTGFQPYSYAEEYPEWQLYEQAENGGPWNRVGWFTDDDINVNSFPIPLWDGDTLHVVDLIWTGSINNISLFHRIASYSNGNYTFPSATTVHNFGSVGAYRYFAAFIVDDNIVVIWYSTLQKKVWKTTFNKLTSAYVSTTEVWSVPSPYSSYATYGEPNLLRGQYQDGIFHIVVHLSYPPNATYEPVFYLKGNDGDWSSQYLCEWGFMYGGVYNGDLYGIMGNDGDTRFYVGEDYYDTDYNQVENMHFVRVNDSGVIRLPIVINQEYAQSSEFNPHHYISMSPWLYTLTVTPEGEVFFAGRLAFSTWIYNDSFNHLWAACFDIPTNTWRGTTRESIQEWGNGVMSPFYYITHRGHYLKTWHRITWEDEGIWYDDYEFVPHTNIGICVFSYGQQGRKGIGGNMRVGTAVPKAVKYPGKYSRI